MDVSVVHVQLAAQQHAIYIHVALVTNAIPNPAQVQAIHVIIQMEEAMHGHPVRLRQRMHVQMAMIMTVTD